MIKITKEQSEQLIVLQAKVDQTLRNCGSVVSMSRGKKTITKPEGTYLAAINQLHSFGYQLGIFSNRKKDGSYYTYGYCT